MSFFAKYKWYLIATLITMGIFLGVTLWLFFATDTPQMVPFLYQSY